MKRLFLGILVFSFLSSSAQDTDEIMVQKTIEAFFDGFHKKDSMVMKKTVGEGIIAQTIGRTKEGKTEVRTEDFNKFLNSIVSIPDSVSFQERLLSFNIQVDGAMANAWTPYEFWLNDTLLHCGVNSFQLVKDDKDWKIIYLIDTRRKKGCK